MIRITTPTLLVDEQKARINISSMARKAELNEVILRPHFKTHQSTYVGEWFRDYGVEKITVSSLTMAKYFAEADWRDITVAFPFNPLEIETANALAARINLNLLVESLSVIEFLSENMHSPVNLFIKVDLGTHRTGMDPDDHEGIFSLIKRIEQSPNLLFAGFLGHAGHSYGSRASEEIMAIHKESEETMTRLKNEFHAPLISVGDTPTCSVAKDFTWTDEIRPGNFVYYDLMQTQIGSCDLSQVAVAMRCPVVSRHASRNELIIYGGAVHFSKDHIIENGEKVFGQVVDLSLIHI